MLGSWKWESLGESAWASHGLVLPLENMNSVLRLYCLWLSATFNRFLESNWFVWVTQMNHIPMHIDYDRNVDWVSTQVRDSHLEDLDMPQLLRRVGGGPKG